MRKLLSIIISGLLLAACSSKEQAPHPAAIAAQDYYDKLKSGDYAGYVAGLAGADSIPEQYRKQLLVNAKQFLAQQKKEHKGVDVINIVSAQDDTLAHCTNVFLEVQFADSLREEIVVAMVKQGSKWLMK